MMKKANIKLLEQLLENAFIEKYKLDPKSSVEHITNDSRQVLPNSIFIALAGPNGNGNNYINNAIAQGACLVLTETAPTQKINTQVPIVYYPGLRDLLFGLLCRFWQIDLSDTSFIGITGTNGKTSIAAMLAQSMNGAYVGTIGMGTIGDLKPTQNTTPDLIALMPFFHEYYQYSQKNYVLEVSSHALEQQRLLGLPITTAVFTNLTHDHLDYHGNMEAYAKAKYKLFLDYPIKNAVINIDDEWGRKLIEILPKNIHLLTYGFDKSADIHPLMCVQSMSGLKLEIRTPSGVLSFTSDLVGHFNISNLMAVIGGLLFGGISEHDIIAKLETLSCIDGRMEVVHQSPYFVVDYAHTPDALEKALSTVKQLCKGQLWCVFGCGGDRDKFKRPLMGKIAQQYADHCIITNDNPRSESPINIAHEIQQGMNGDGVATIILDRAKAIEYCVKNANKNDVVLIAGKGHEDYQIIGNNKRYFSDKKCIQSLL